MHKLCVSTLQECEPPHTLGYTSFRKIWKRYVPDVRVMTPRTDVCANCDRLRGEVARAKTEEQTVAAMAALTAHTAPPPPPPPVLSPPGMSQARHEDLQKMVAPYFSGEAQVALPWP